MGHFALSSLKPHGVCIVEALPSGWLGSRLSGLGITPGAKLVRLFDAPSGDPSAYLVRGTVVAVRRRDAERILVRGCGHWA